LTKHKWLTPRRRANLERLADYLESLQRNYKHFDMGRYAFYDGDGLDAAPRYSTDPLAFLNNCGAVACALGHGPAAGIPFSKSHIREHWRVDIDWDSYSGRNFIPRTRRADRGAAWAWAFGGCWSDVDNHHYGAAARIRYLLAGNDVPGRRNGWGEFVGDPPAQEHKNLYAPFHIDNRVPQPVTP
jgi:hypothetical protein